MSRRVLLTGAGGFIGAHTIVHLMANTSWDLVCIDSFRHRGRTDRVAHVLKDNPEWKSRVQVVTHDLNAPMSPQLVSKIGRIDYVINMASESHVDRSIEDPVSFILNNVNLTLNMLEYARIAKPITFIQISTDEVYGPAKDGYEHKEWDTMLPSNPYSASKAAQEAIAISYWRTYGIPVVITNTMNNFGEMQDTEKFIPMIIQRVNKGEMVTIHGSEDYIGKRHYLHARNHADAILFILENLPASKYKELQEISLMEDGSLETGIADRPDRYNVVGETEADNLDMAEKIAAFMNKPLYYRLVDFHKGRPGHDRRYALSGEKLQRLGWNPPINFEDSLKSTVEWTLNHKEWIE